MDREEEYIQSQRLRPEAKYDVFRRAPESFNEELRKKAVLLEVPVVFVARPHIWREYEDPDRVPDEDSDLEEEDQVYWKRRRFRARITNLRTALLMKAKFPNTRLKENMDLYFRQHKQVEEEDKIYLDGLMREKFHGTDVLNDSIQYGIERRKLEEWDLARMQAQDPPTAESVASSAGQG